MNIRKMIATLALLFVMQASNAQSKFDITISRTMISENCTMGYLMVNGETLCYTLELPWKDNQNNISCIPAGTYRGTLRYDHTDGWRIELKDVPNRTNVEIHVGNYTSDIEGCILVGSDANAKDCTVQDSRAAYAKLKDKFYGSSSPISTPDCIIRVKFEQ